MFRVQKSLLAEYQEIYEPVLVESPFAEVTESGIGIKQVQIGLTPSKLIIGQDVFKTSQSSLTLLTGVPIIQKDPEIECFELINILPLEALSISFYKKKIRVVMEVKILDQKSVYYEFGGFLERNLYWNTWRERIVTLRYFGPNLLNISRSSPLSSTDAIPDEEEVFASVHLRPRSDISSDETSTYYPLPGVDEFYRKFSSAYTDTIEKAPSVVSNADSHQQMELQNYHRSLVVTNSYSCGCSTSW